MRFLRTLAESLAWKDDRIALAVFAHIAAPQVRLTKDANTFFFFLDHLGGQSPFPIEDDTTWDTNIELGIRWGLRLIEKGRRAVWKEPERESVRARLGRAGVERRGRAGADDRAGTGYPGLCRSAWARVPAASSLRPSRRRRARRRMYTSIRRSNRQSLARVAAAGGGRYLELDREGDREIANEVIAAARRRAGSRGVQVGAEDLHWQLLGSAAALLAIGMLFLVEPTELLLHALGAGAALALVWTLTR